MPVSFRTVPTASFEQAGPVRIGRAILIVDRSGRGGVLLQV
jgi:hypothetical protein